MGEYAALIMFGAVFCILLLGYPVALTLGGTALIAAAFGIICQYWDCWRYGRDDGFNVTTHHA